MATCLRHYGTCEVYIFSTQQGSLYLYFYMCKLICSQVAHLERSGHYLTVKDNQVSELLVDLEEHTIMTDM